MRDRHVIEIEPIDADRAYWECSCGTSGSAPEWRADEAAELHIPPGSSVSYRHPIGRDTPTG